jgi:hypothetical protein
VWSANRTARHMTRAISEIHIMAAPTDRRGGRVCRICSGHCVLRRQSEFYPTISPVLVTDGTHWLMGGFQQCTSGKWKLGLTRHKRTPGSPSSRGLASCCFVGSCDPGGFGVSGGWGSRRDRSYGLLFNRLLHLSEVIPITGWAIAARGQSVAQCIPQSQITVPSPHTVSTPHSSGEYDQGANHDHDNCKLKEGGEVHIKPDTALRLSANRR